MPTKKPTVAIVEDHQDTAEIWRRKLIRADYEVVGVYASARAAWKALRKSPPDAILLDWELIPGPNGDWLLKQFTKFKLPTRIMVVTSHDNGGVQTQAFALGAQGFVGKHGVPARAGAEAGGDAARQGAALHAQRGVPEAAGLRVPVRRMAETLPAAAADRGVVLAGHGQQGNRLGDGAQQGHD